MRSTSITRLRRNPGRPIATRFLTIATHDTYHAGQIQYLVALQEIPVEEFTAAASRNDLPRMEGILTADTGVINMVSRDGWTALHVASYFGMIEAVRLLLARGALPNTVSRNAEASTPLHLAVGGIANRTEIVRLLLEAGANARVPDGSGKTPLETARAPAEPALIALLERQSP